jgi:ABC-type multidrug transport system fused ATPase/permease subunit
MSNYAARRRPQTNYDVPFVGWSELQAHLAENWQQGQHVAIIGKTGSGKSHLALQLLDIKPFVIIIATKRYDPLLDEAAKGYIV